MLVAPTYSINYALMMVVHSWSDFFFILRLGLYMILLGLMMPDSRIIKVYFWDSSVDWKQEVITAPTQPSSWFNRPEELQAAFMWRSFIVLTSFLFLAVLLYFLLFFQLSCCRHSLLYVQEFGHIGCSLSYSSLSAVSRKQESSPDDWRAPFGKNKSFKNYRVKSDK